MRTWWLAGLLLVPSLLDPGRAAAGAALWAAAAALVVAGVLTRRAAPLVSLALATSLVLFAPWLGSQVWTLPATVVLCALAGRRLPELWRAQLVFLAVGLAGLLLSWTVARTQDALTIALLVCGGALLPWWIGTWWRQRAALARAGWERAEELETRQRLVAERARSRERARIAQDVHDSLGHELSVIALLAGGLELAPGMPDTHRATVVDLRERATVATERLHEAIGLLREDAAPPSHPEDETVAELVARAVRSGLPVRLVERGTAGSPSLLSRLAAHRVVREALTNATKHAPGAPVTVRVSNRGDALLVTVVNPVPAHADPPGAPGSGTGLVGLDERVRQAGGTLRVRRGGGRFAVAAWLPGTPAAPGPSRQPPPGPVESAAGETGAMRRALRAGLRGRTRRAALAPALAGGALLLVFGGLHVVSVSLTAVDPADVAGMRLGQTRQELAPALPSRSIDAPPPVVEEPPAPEGADCRYYRSREALWRFGGTLYRLCFVDDVLVAKDRL
ncbi:Signal transduction histidine kinase [Streptomyces zhaozhouensis]|uniref:histidine kinase n=1 Tax=Streptomyces zhaozhouensis TaxID=1300267 RepID=A0A286E0N2_9ACTN|nr:sensor histidine kinase [Streptomyces zhaozhouensis]SOD64464.1 Signal transduction histidine kinase [Streptomyces zhaozhouensis]